MDLRVFGLLIALCYFGGCSAFEFSTRDCRVSNFRTMADFDKQRYSGTWYAVSKKDPNGLFLYDDIVANFEVDANNKMTATARGNVYLFGTANVCADMVGTFTDTEEPGKFIMKYYGMAAYLERGTDEHWVVDTDYDNYSIIYSCRDKDENGECEDSYSFVFSRSREGLQPAHQRIVRKRQEELCLARKYRRVEHTGYCNDLY
ncbi:retinol-binding protein 4 [Hyperolius riggenbachi]|uniref:retinol-binding protein 4 n=1 Tax=Hyperolius riggenbachi TaxID=752182 RepID=UPI0035A29B9F